MDSGFHGSKLPGLRITMGRSKCEGGASRERKARRESKCVEGKRTKTYPPSPNHGLFRGKLTNAIGT